MSGTNKIIVTIELRQAAESCKLIQSSVTGTLFEINKDPSAQKTRSKKYIY